MTTTIDEKGGSPGTWDRQGEPERRDAASCTPGQWESPPADPPSWEAARHYSPNELKYEILRLLTASPHLDDEELAEALGETTAFVSGLLREMADEGVIEPA